MKNNYTGSGYRNLKRNEHKKAGFLQFSRLSSGGKGEDFQHHIIQW